MCLHLDAGRRGQGASVRPERGRGRAARDCSTPRGVRSDHPPLKGPRPPSSSPPLLFLIIKTQRAIAARGLHSTSLHQRRERAQQQQRSISDRGKETRARTRPPARRAAMFWCAPSPFAPSRVLTDRGRTGYQAPSFPTRTAPPLPPCHLSTRAAQARHLSSVDDRTSTSPLRLPGAVVPPLSSRPEQALRCPPSSCLPSLSMQHQATHIRVPCSAASRMPTARISEQGSTMLPSFGAAMLRMRCDARSRLLQS
jgi:hypothetical protein